MEIELSRDEARRTINGMTTEELLNTLEFWGVEFKVELTLDDLPSGTYRRESGMDLISNIYGTFRPVNILGIDNDVIAWTCFHDEGEWWVQVLDLDNRPVLYGTRFKVDKSGSRLA